MSEDWVCSAFRPFAQTDHCRHCGYPASYHEPEPLKFHHEPALCAFFEDVTRDLAPEPCS